MAERGGIEDPCIAEARLGAGERVEKPHGVGEVGSHGRAGLAEEVHEGLGGRLLRAELSVMWQRLGGVLDVGGNRTEIGRRPCFGKVSV